MTMRNFDYGAQFEAVKKSATDALKEIFPIEGKLRSLKIDNIWVEDKADAKDYATQAALKTKDGTWGVPVYASMSLVDKATGKVIDHAEKIKMFNLPKITDRLSYIVKGNEYQVTNQFRLKPGVYTIRKQNGELKTQVNLAKGRPFDLAFNEPTGQFFIKKIGGGQANIPLYPLLTHLGMSATAISAAWGSKLEAANHLTDPKIVQRAEAAFGVKKGDLKSYLDTTQISPETTKRVLGQSFERVDGPMLLAASKNLLEVHLGKKDPVDRDSLAFKELHSVEDFIHERIQKNKKALSFRVSRSIDNLKRTKIEQIVNPALFSSVVENFFTQDDKSNTPEQTNPLEMISGGYRATIMGSGGVTSEHAITASMREIHPTQYGFLDPIHSPESNVGVNMHLTIGAVKDGKELKMVVVDKNKKPVSLTPIEAFNKTIAFPSQSGPKYKALYQGKVIQVPLSKVDYFTSSPMALFSPTTNLVPYLPADQGNRAMMASKMLEQAISLKHREAPHVQVGIGDGRSMEEVIGGGIAVKAPEDGTIRKVTPDYILLRTPEGDKKINLYNNFVLNRKSFLNHNAVVKEGDKVKAGQLLADSNFTKGGVLALGANLKTAYVPYRGYNFDDGIVITESAAEKLTSEHIHKSSYDRDLLTVLNLVAFKSNYPNVITSENNKKLDDDGVVKKGSVVKTGDILIAAMRKRNPSIDLALLGKSLSNRPKDDAVRWTMEDDGIVMDVQKSTRGITVQIKTEERAKIGDKLSNRHGGKGVITHIIPNARSPRNASGEHVEVMLNPAGVISRINIGQIYESAAAKAAAKMGTPAKIVNFTGENYLKTTKELLRKAGVDDKEELFDGESGKSIGQVHVGNPQILKLFKQASSNFSIRQGGPGHPYDVNMQPLKAGGEESSKALDLLTLYCMLSHGARANLREMSTTKSSANEEYWKALKSGQQLPPPKVPFIYDKFLNYLKGAGIDVKKNGTKLQLGPLTDKQTMEMSSGEIKNPRFYRAKDLQPIKGGMFDPVVMGGFNGSKWGHLNLTEPTLNPVFENAAKKLTGLGGKFDDILAGKLHVNSQGELNSEGKGLTGGAAIEKILKGIDVDEGIASLMRKAKVAKGVTLDDVNKKLRYLTALKEAGLKPHEAYIRRALPVIPTAYRPIYPRPDGNVTVSDLNHIYQNIGIINNMMKMGVMEHLPEEDKANIRADLYNHIKGLSGLTDINIKGRPREGFISEIKGGTGGQPKEGMFIAKLLSKKQDFVGRGTAIPDSDLGIDEVGVPEDMAWKMYEPFVIRELSTQGKTPLQAKEEITKRTLLARRALDIVMKDRKLLINRAPSLHKFSIMSFTPKIVPGKSIRVQPLINKGFNLDHDGDAVVAHVPISDEANAEADMMKPSMNLFQPGTGSLMIAPSQEAQVGLYYLSKTPAGIARINKLLPKSLWLNGVLDRAKSREFMNKIAKSVPPNEFGIIVKTLKSEGEKHAFERGFTLGINDLAQVDAGRNALIKNLNRRLKGAKTEAELKDINTEYTKRIDVLIGKKLKDKNNPLYDMVESGAKGNASNLRSIVATPLLVTDTKLKIIPKTINKSYTEGLDIEDYWLSMYGARRGMMDRSIQTSIPGAFSKDVMATTLDNVISGEDCGTKEGIILPINSSDSLDRFTAGDQRGFPHNTLVDSKVIAQLRKKGTKVVKVRSPLRCLKPKGTCAKCYGIDEHGHLPSIGDNIGVKAGQAISEPLYQMVLNCSEGLITDSSGKAYAFEDYYEEVDSEEAYDGRCRTKLFEGQITDDACSVEVSSIQSHHPDDQMIFLKTKAGHTLLVQANHPIWVYENDGSCFEVLAEDVKKGDKLKIDLSPILIQGQEDAPFNPYFIGRYLADGCTRYGNGTPGYNGVPVATIVTGADIAIKEKTFKSSEGKGTISKKDVQIYNVSFANKFRGIVRGRRARDKRLMPGFNLWKNEDLTKLLAGFIDGDSYCFIKHGKTLVARVCTSSYLILQQMEMICHKLDIKFNPCVTPQGPLQKSPAFAAELRFKDRSVYDESIKMSRFEFSPAKYEIKHSKYEPVIATTRMWMWNKPVWDIKTESRGFTCGLIRNHNSFHTGGTAGSASLSGYGRINQLLQLPKIVVGSAALVPVSGKVAKITKGLAGGYDVVIGDHIVHVAKGLNLKVTIGQEVEIGDPISDGVIKPQDLVKLKGMKEAQHYIASELQEAYKAQGQPIHRKVFETIVRSLGNTTKVLNNPNDSGYLPGDVIPYTIAEHHNANLEFDCPIDVAAGYKLAAGVEGFKAGHIITADDAKLMKARGLHVVRAARDPIVHAPFLKGMSTLPLLKRNWMSALGYRYLAKNLVEGAGQGWTTDLSDYHPIPAFAHGESFGKGQEGKY